MPGILMARVSQAPSTEWDITQCMSRTFLAWMLYVTYPRSLLHHGCVWTVATGASLLSASGKDLHTAGQWVWRSNAFFEDTLHIPLRNKCHSSPRPLPPAVHMCVHVCVCICSCLCACGVYVHKCVFVCVCICSCLCVYIHMCMCSMVCVRVHTMVCVQRAEVNFQDHLSSITPHLVF